MLTAVSSLRAAQHARAVCIPLASRWSRLASAYWATNSTISPQHAAPWQQPARGFTSLGNGDDVAGSKAPTPELSVSEVASMLKQLVGPLSFGDLVFGIQVRRGSWEG